ncbi:hypothetical protein RND71_013964 [Anisodus tanguticus]|uniref:Cupin type-1 domain-containing protein n=1 Tax=Anisodus tanguticus TaxID=243964 RepID=A0AAE1VMA6_9SOLA|nr:hypothetical protein RND71_013964 [Anisodus tanguticus]
MRLVIRCNSLSLPNIRPMPRLVYTERGRAILGITQPGRAETFQSQSSHTFQAGREPREERGQGRRSDQHQKVHRIRQGDIVVIPAGVAHWAYNDGEEEFVAVMVNDLNHRSNQLDQNFRAFYLAGGVPETGRQNSEIGLLSGQQSTQRFQNIFRAFDRELMAEAFNIPVDIVRRMQEEQSERGLIVNVRERMSMIKPDEEEEEEFEEQQGRPGRGEQWWNALFSPHWTMTGHSVVYVQRGDAQVQVVDHSGKQVMSDRVNQGEMFVAPQYFLATMKAGQNGFEFVVFRTSSEPMNSQTCRYIGPENLLAEYGGLKKEKDVEFSTDDKVLEISIKPCSFGLIKMPVKEDCLLKILLSLDTLIHTLLIRSLKHQRKWKSDPNYTKSWYDRGAKIYQADKYRKSACEK